MARVTYELEAVQQLAGLPNVVLARLENIVRRLQNWPDVSGAKPLRAERNRCGVTWRGITAFGPGTIEFSFALSVPK